MLALIEKTFFLPPDWIGKVSELNLQSFTPFLAYIGQPDDHKCWATSLPFTSIYPTNLRTNLWNFHKKSFENWRSWKSQFFWVSHFEIVPIQISHILWGTKDGMKFCWFHWFPEKSGGNRIMRHIVEYQVKEPRGS